VKLTRRVLLQRAMLAMAALPIMGADASEAREGGPGDAGAAALPHDVKLLLCDSRSAASVELVAGHALPVIDVAGQAECRWRQLRAHSGSGAVAGLTRWSDLVQARGVLQDRGLRLRVEQARGSLFYWEMA
jgi:uncharacterized protein YcgI (DUF1989 family)